MESDYSFNFPNHSLIMDFRLKVNGQNLVLSINEINVDFDLVKVNLKNHLQNDSFQTCSSQIFEPGVLLLSLQFC